MIVLALLAAAAISAPFAPKPAAYTGRAMRIARADGTSEVIAAATDGPNLRLIVEFTTPPLTRQNTSTLARFREDFARLPAARAIHREYTRAFSGAAISIAPSQLQAIASLPYVRRVYRDARVTAMDAEQGVVTIRADQVWSVRGTKGAGVTVAIIDTGIDYRHPALGGGFGAGFKVVGGYDFVHNDADPMDDSGHGTHVAGIVAANSPELTGVAPEASLVAYKVLDANGSGWTSDVIAALERSVSDRVDVVNLSLGFTGSADDALSRAVDNAVAAGVVVVAAAGNLRDFQSVSSPGTAEAAITVGATDFQDALASFSSKGPSPGGYAIKPDVVAPGVNVVSAKLGGGTLAASGTSMASPHVAGAAALLRALHRDWTPAEIKSALVTTAVPVPVEAMAAGAGRIDALHAATETTVVTPSQLAFGIIDGNAATWSGTRSLTVTNHGSAARSYDVIASGAADGIRLTTTPATLQLAPGASAPVELRIDVDNAKVPYPGAGSLVPNVRSMTYSGTVELRASDDSLRVPWAFIKAARLRVRYGDDMEAVVFMGSRNSPRPVLPPIGLNVWELLVPPAAYDFVLVAFASPDDTRETTMIVRESQQVTGVTDYALTPADAPYHLTFQASDERGLPLRGAGSGVTCEPTRILSGPLFLPWPGLDLIYSTGTWREVTAYPPNVRTSAFTNRYSFAAGETCGDPALTRFYTLQYPRIDSASADVTRSAGGSQLAAQQVRLIFPPPADGTRIFGLESRVSDLGAREGFAGAFVSALWPSKEWNGTVYLTRNTDPDVNLVPELEAQTNGSYVHSQPLRAVDGGVASFAGSKPLPATYVAAGGATLELGLGVAAPQLLFQSAPGGVDVQVGFSGQLDEVMFGRGSTQYRLFDSGGGLLASASDHLTVDLSQPRRLEIDAAQTHWVGSREGHASITARLGGTAADRLPPRMTSIAVVDASSRPAESIARGSSAWLRFSAVDTLEGTSAPQHVKPEGTQAWIRLEGTSEWRPLQAVLRDDDIANAQIYPKKGTTFEAALAEVANSEGVFDVRIRVEDASGNSTETVLEPAFAVTPGHARSRAVRH